MGAGRQVPPRGRRGPGSALLCFALSWLFCFALLWPLRLPPGWGQRGLARLSLFLLGALGFVLFSFKPVLGGGEGEISFQFPPPLLQSRAALGEREALKHSGRADFSGSSPPPPTPAPPPHDWGWGWRAASVPTPPAGPRGGGDGWGREGRKKLKKRLRGRRGNGIRRLLGAAPLGWARTRRGRAEEQRQVPAGRPELFMGGGLDSLAQIGAAVQCYPRALRSPPPPPPPLLGSRSLGAPAAPGITFPLSSRLFAWGFIEKTKIR